MKLISYTGMKILLIIAVFSTTLTRLPAQQRLQVITKRIQKSIAHPPGAPIQIEADRAEIRIESWEYDSIRLELHLVSKHPKKEVAATELDLMQYFIGRFGEGIMIRNFLAGQEDSRPTSNLKAKYYLKVPKGCSLDIRNAFGLIWMEDLTGQVEIKGEFCEVTLKSHTGDVTIQSYFGDVNGESITGQVSIQSDRSAITLSNISGKQDLSAKYGEISLDIDKTNADIRIEAQQSNINLTGVSGESGAYSLHAQAGEIRLPKSLPFRQTPNGERATFSPASPTFSIDATTTFGRIFVAE